MLVGGQSGTFSALPSLYGGYKSPPSPIAAPYPANTSEILAGTTTPISSFTETFTTADTTKWTSFPAEAVVTAGQLRLTSGLGYPRIISLNRYSLIGSELIIELVASAGGPSEDYLLLRADASNVVGFVVTGAVGSRTLAFTNTASFPSITYDPVAHRWLRLTESAGTITWWTSPDGLTWTSRRTAAVTFPLASMTVEIMSGYAGTAPAGPLTVDNINVPPTGSAPAQVTGLAANGRTGGVDLTWTAVAGATSYKVYRGGSLIGTSSFPLYSDLTGTSGITYSYTVVASNTAGDGTASSAANGTALATAAPLARWQSALATQATSPATWIPFGDSITEGQGASVRANRWIEKARDQIRTALGISGGTGYLPAWYGTYGPDSTWQPYAGRSGTITDINWGVDWGERAADMAVGATITYNVTGTAIDVWYMTNGGTLSVVVDGGAPTTINTAGVYAGDNRQRITFGAGGAHTVVITATVTNCYFSGLMVFNGDASTGVHLYDSGHSGYKASDFLSHVDPPEQWDQLPQMVELADPDLVTVALGTNDVNAAVPVATFKYQIAALIARIRMGAPETSVVVVVMYGWPDSGWWTPYATALRDLVTEDPTLGIIDFFTTMGSATAGGNWSSDALHPSNTGHSVMGTQAATYLAPTATARQGSGAGSWSFTGAGAGTRTPKGSGSGSWSFAGTGTGKRTPKASGTGSFTFTGTGAGTSTHRGTGSGSWTVTGTGTGTTARRGSGSGSFTFAGSGAGKRVAKATGTGSWSFVGAGTGATVRRGTGSGTATWTGTGSGVAPGVGVKSGSGTGSWGFVGTGSGKRTPKATAAGTATTTGSAAGKRTPKATGAGTVTTTGSAVGRRVPKASGTGTVAISGSAVGSSATAYTPHVPVTAVLTYTPATANLASNGVGTATLTAPSGFGEVFGESFGGWQPIGTATVSPFELATATLTTNGAGTATLSGNGVSTATVTESYALADIQLV